jgi:hypothetical protein
VINITYSGPILPTTPKEVYFDYIAYMTQGLSVSSYIPSVPSRWISSLSTYSLCNIAKKNTYTLAHSILLYTT